MSDGDLIPIIPNPPRTRRITTIFAALLMMFGVVAVSAVAGQGSTPLAAANGGGEGGDCYEQITEYKYVKYTRERSRETVNDEWGPWSEWTVWGDGTTIQWSTQNVEVLEEGDHDGQADEYSTYDRDYRYQNTGETRTVNGDEISCPSKPITGKGYTDHECDATEWHFVITQVDEEANAPASIHVVWANGNEADVPLDKLTGGVAHYQTTANLDSSVVSITTSIYIEWSGQFNVSHGPCEPPPYECPAGTNWVDADQDGKVDEGECFTEVTYEMSLVLVMDCVGEYESGTIEVDLVYPDRLDPLNVFLSGGVRFVVIETLSSYPLSAGQLEALEDPVTGYFTYGDGGTEFPITVEAQEPEECEMPAEYAATVNIVVVCVEGEAMIQPTASWSTTGDDEGVSLSIFSGAAGSNAGAEVYRNDELPSTGTLSEFMFEPASDEILVTFAFYWYANAESTHEEIRFTPSFAVDKDCSPELPYECPGGTTWVDKDEDGVVEEGECETPPPPVDVCPNISGNQPSVPEGMVVDNAGNCVTPPPPPTDVCPNIEGVQQTAPWGTVVDDAGNCVIPLPSPLPSPDVCPNIDGVQSSVPSGMVKDGAGNCVTPPPPPTDVCPNIDGVQPSVPSGMVKDNAGNCVTPPSGGLPETL